MRRRARIKCSYVHAFLPFRANYRPGRLSRAAGRRAPRRRDHPRTPHATDPAMTEEHTLVAARFRVVAEASPGLLPRLLQPLAKRDLTADTCHAVREGEMMRVEIALHAMPEGMVHLVAGNLGQVIGVVSVRTEAAALRAAA